MNAHRQVYAPSVCTGFVLILTGVFFKTVIACSPDPYRPQRDITELAILAPIVIVARVVNISVESDRQMFTSYSACLDTKEVIKSEDSIAVPRIFCTKEFGTEAMCLAHVFPNTSYVFYLENNLEARYDAHFSAVKPATDFVIALARRGYCNMENSTNCVPPNMTDVPKKYLEVNEGERVFLKCRASGTKPYVVTWLFKGGSRGMSFDSYVAHDGSLILNKVTASCAGKYTCVVKNAAASVSRETKITVKLKPCGSVMMVNKRLHITSPNFPGEYDPDKSCVWRLCPPRSHRVRFHFNDFNLHRSDSIRIDNECGNSRDPWRKYCGAVSPGVFVSRCKNKCVVLRLISNIKFKSEDPFGGMNVTVEPTRGKRTKRFNVLKHYCDSDLVIKGRYIVRNPWSFNKIKVFALDSFKQPFSSNSSYDIMSQSISPDDHYPASSVWLEHSAYESERYKNQDIYGCYYQYDFSKDYIYFVKATNGVFNVKTAITDDTRQGAYLKKVLQKYKNKDSLCKLPERERI